MSLRSIISHWASRLFLFLYIRSLLFLARAFDEGLLEVIIIFTYVFINIRWVEGSLCCVHILMTVVCSMNLSLTIQKNVHVDEG